MLSQKRLSGNIRILFNCIVPPAGLEPATYWLRVSSSTDWATEACYVKSFSRVAVNWFLTRWLLSYMLSVSDGFAVRNLFSTLLKEVSHGSPWTGFLNGGKFLTSVGGWFPLCIKRIRWSRHSQPSSWTFFLKKFLTSYGGWFPQILTRFVLWDHHNRWFRHSQPHFSKKVTPIIHHTFTVISRVKDTVFF